MVKKGKANEMNDGGVKNRRQYFKRREKNFIHKHLAANYREMREEYWRVKIELKGR